ncbi:hypothetical protein [Plesiocystis pacifica]|uniref:hypothetical protein n=1 Tax=Plesiocystis pacifica TaxID=191768 RepID=UPI0012F8AC9E|nr:hypothetical protein [Plesiocystis pacifica]
MDRRRRLVVTTGSVALMLVVAQAEALAGPPPPPPPSSDDGSGAAPAPLDGASDTNPRSRRTNAPPPPSGGGGSIDSGGVSDPLNIDQRTPDTDLTGTWSFSRTARPRPNYISSAEEDPFFQINPIGYYQGVTVAGGNTPPFAPREVGGETAVLTWTGFERGDGSSRVFFQLSTAVTPDVGAEGMTITVTLPSTAITVRNNRRKLITKFFNTPVNDVVLRRKGKDVVVTMNLRWESEVSWKLEDGANGYQLLVFEFPDYASEDDANTPPPPPSPPPTPSDDGDSGDAEGGPFLPTD